MEVNGANLRSALTQSARPTGFILTSACLQKNRQSHFQQSVSQTILRRKNEDNKRIYLKQTLKPVTPKEGDQARQTRRKTEHHIKSIS
jgi:hypothetical protein